MKLTNILHKKNEYRIIHPKSDKGHKELDNSLPTKNIVREKLQDNVNTDTLVIKRQTNKYYAIIGGVYLVLILLGIITGYVLAISSKSKTPVNISNDQQKTGPYTGPVDTSQFSDSASGILEKGGIDGEGTHKLVRDGGPTQTAYLTSSVIDLDLFVGKKVKVWGQTMAGEKAAWFMDVGKIEITE